MVVGKATTATTLEEDETKGNVDVPMEIDSENPIPDTKYALRSNSGSRLESEVTTAIDKDAVVQESIQKSKISNTCTLYMYIVHVALNVSLLALRIQVAFL